MSDKKSCPLLFGHGGVLDCYEEGCQWWRKYAKDCAIGVLADVLADSKISQNSWPSETEATPNPWDSDYDPYCVF